VRDEQRSAVAAGSAERLARAARAARELCDVLWESLGEQLHEPDAARIGELSARIADVSASVAMIASAPPVRAAAASGPAERRTPPEPVPPEPEHWRLPHQPAEQARSQPASPAPLRPEGPAPGPASFAPPSGDDRPGPDLRLAPHPESEPPIEQSRSRPAPDTPPPLAGYTFTRIVDEHPSAAHAPTAVAESPGPRIEIRDVRREEGPSAWITSVGRLLERHTVDRLPFAILLIEIVDVARLERSETPHDLHGIVRQVERALGEGMRASDELSRETLGRYWLAAPKTDTDGARMLAERLAHLVRSTASHRGVPLEVAIGIAMCPHDGTEAPALAARADLGVYAARANGHAVAHTEPPQG
jgi:GGDEF domain-containing protein